jgi:prepilin-type N-terminal cleavage/methylation domain-containing protein
MQKGFTLVELLIVIAILAVLSVTVVVVLNPAELLKQARDSTRISDLASVNSAIALYLTDVSTPYLNGSSTACSSYTGYITNTTTTPFSGAVTTVSSTAVDGSGWIKVNLTGITGGSPLARLPIDPVNTGSQFYAYGCGSNGALSYEIDTNMESTKYAQGGGSDVESNSKDGGNKDYLYEVGSYLQQ